VSRPKIIWGIVTKSLLRIDAQKGKLHLSVLLDSESARSLISFKHFKQLCSGGPALKLAPK
jgi:hypothetical protein